MIFYLTNVALDIAFGSIFWIAKKTKNGITYLVWGDKTPKLIKYEQDDIEKLMEKTNIQEKEIELLKKNIQELKNQFKTNS